ncbi:MAG: cyclic nucleotide-binding domain-containing protein [Deltaproteobacteria bacterium]|nr:cyclic nucleotide-binding domain-containing protein [Deltaproteobacteria bacterium]
MVSNRGGEPDRAELRRNLRQLRHALTLQPLDLDARVRVARTLRLLGRPREAVAHYRAVARYLALSAQPLRAIGVLKELLQVDPKHEETLLFLAKLYARTRGAAPANVGRVAVPIDDGNLPRMLTGTWPMSSSGVWRAIRPRETSELVRELTLEEAGASGEFGLPPAEDDDVTLVTEPPEAMSGMPAPIDFGNGLVDDQEVTEPEIAMFAESYEIIGEPSAEELLLPSVPLFSSLSQRAFVDLARAMVHKRLSAGSVLFCKGDPGDSLMLISSGRVHAYRPTSAGDTLIETLKEGDLIGVLALISPRRRAATLVAETNVEYFEIEKRVIDRLFKDHPAIEKVLHKFARHRLIMSALAQLPVFRLLPTDARNAIARRFKQRRFTAGDQLVYEGAEINTLILLLRGRVSVGPEGPSGEVEQPLARLEPGDVVGCIAALDGEVADACIQADDNGICTMVPHKVFEDLIAVFPTLRMLRAGLDEDRCMMTEHIFSDSVGMQTEQLKIEDD